MNTLVPPQRQLLQQFFRKQLAPVGRRRVLHLPHSRSLQSTSNVQSLQQRSIWTSGRTRFARKPQSWKNGVCRRRFASAAGEENLSLSQRLRKLSREYGWSAVGVYFLLSAADFPFCFLAVKTLGTDRIGRWEHIVVSKIKDVVSWPFDQTTQETIDGAVQEIETQAQVKVPVEKVEGHGDEKRILEEEETLVIADHGYKEAAQANSGSNASLWTQLALAYAIHKSFIFIRVPLTAAVTPKVVKTLRSWGWNIGKRPSKVATSSPGVNTKGSGVKSE